MGSSLAFKPNLTPKIGQTERTEKWLSRTFFHIVYHIIYLTVAFYSLKHYSVSVS